MVSLTNATFQPSDPMTIDGTFTLDGTDTFRENIDSGSNFGALDVQGAPGTAVIDGTLDINLPDGFAFLTNGESFTILDAMGGLSGTFSSIVGDTFGSSGTWSVEYSADAVTLTANVPTSTTTPEPATLFLFGTGLLGLAWLATRKRRTAARQG